MDIDSDAFVLVSFFNVFFLKVLERISYWTSRSDKYLTLTTMTLSPEAVKKNIKNMKTSSSFLIRPNEDVSLSN